MFNSIISSIHFIAATRYQFRKCVNFAHVDVKRGLFVTPLLPGVVCDTEFVRATFHCADDNYFKWTAYICGKISNPEITCQLVSIRSRTLNSGISFIVA